MKKRIRSKYLMIIATILILTFTALSGCDKDTKDAKSNKEKIEINIAALKGPTGMGMVKLMEDAEGGKTANDYNFTVAGEADVISTGLVKGEFDIAAVPCNLASVLYNKTEGNIKIAGINTLGVLYIVETGNTINAVEDLKGKTIYSTGFGTTPQYTLNYLLSLYGLDSEKDVTIEYKTEATEVAAMLEGATDAIAMLPQPYVTTVMVNNDKVRIALDIEKEWKAANNNNGVVTGVVVVNSEFLKNNPEAVEEFLNEYEESANFVNSDVEKAAELVEKFGLFKAVIAKKALPYCNITLIRNNEMKEMVKGYLGVLFEQNPKAVGGALPADDFYHVN
ncbi:MAG: ABC transporter substrate-binding protein [Herbinix sp.]|nr:ABC transporter substrate-binding protein [Herbinix sp.]